MTETLKIDYNKVKDDCVKWIRDYFKNNANDKTSVVIGISGGKDSTVAAALLVEALGKDRVFGVLMPNGNQKDIDDSYRVCEYLDINYLVVNIKKVYKRLCFQILGLDSPNKRTATNLPSRLRMSILYTIASEYNNGNCRVVNTSNFAEKLIGYGTLWGDTAGDFSPLGLMFVNDVISVGYIMDLPHDLLIKAPADGMTGKTDEDILGFTYDEVEDVWMNPDCKSLHKNIIEKRIKDFSWKRNLINIPTFDPRS